MIHLILIMERMTGLHSTLLTSNLSRKNGSSFFDKYRVYYFANGSLQNDALAVRAQEEYETYNALNV